MGVLAVALTLVLAACGGSGDSEGVASLTDTTAQTTTDGAQGSDSGSSQLDPQEAALDYTQCMREHGVDMPDPDANGGLQLNVGPGDDPKKVEEAQEACQDILQDAGPRLSEEQQGVMQDALLAFAKCMREHGVNMPDPQFGEGGIVTQRQSAGESGGLNPDDPKFQEAQKACAPILDEARRKADLPESSQSPGFNRSGGGS